MSLDKFKNIIKTLFCLWLVFLTTIYSFRVTKPNFDSWQFAKGIIFTSQKLPLAKMFPFSHRGNNFPISSGQKGFVLTGVPTTLPSGDWQFNLEIIPTCENQEIGLMEVVREEGRKIYASKTITAQKLGQNQIESLKFTSKIGSDYEFRLNSNGSCGFKIKNAWLVK